MFWTLVPETLRSISILLVTLWNIDLNMAGIPMGSSIRVICVAPLILFFYINDLTYRDDTKIAAFFRWLTHSGHCVSEPRDGIGRTLSLEIRRLSLTPEKGGTSCRCGIWLVIWVSQAEAHPSSCRSPHNCFKCLEVQGVQDNGRLVLGRQRMCDHRWASTANRVSHAKLWYLFEFTMLRSPEFRLWPASRRGVLPPRRP